MAGNRRELFVKGFPKDYNEADLRSHFAPHDGKCSITLSRRKPGIATVRLSSDGAAAEAARQLDGRELGADGALLAVNTPNFDRDARNRLFPHLSPQQRALLRLDETAAFSVSHQDSAARITRWIRQFCPEAKTVTDATACAGGNALSFAAHFERVQAVEQHKGRFEDLRHNLQVLGCDRVCRAIHADYLGQMLALEQDVVFCDAPWGGPEYAQKEAVALFLGQTNVADVCKTLYEKKRCRLTVLKVPHNFDVPGLVTRLFGSSSLSSSPSSSSSAASAGADSKAAAGGDVSADRGPFMAQVRCSDVLYMFADNASESRREFEHKVQQLDKAKAVIQWFKEGRWQRIAGLAEPIALARSYHGSTAAPAADGDSDSRKRTPEQMASEVTSGAPGSNSRSDERTAKRARLE